VTLDFGGFEGVLFNTPGNGQQNATINNIPPDFNANIGQKNSIKLSFDEEVAPEGKRLSKKRAFVDSTIKIQESCSSDNLSTPAAGATAADCKIVLNLFDDDELVGPPAKKAKKAEVPPKLVPVLNETFFKS
jgi:hypothetical protein